MNPARNAIALALAALSGCGGTGSAGPTLAAPSLTPPSRFEIAVASPDFGVTIVSPNRDVQAIGDIGLIFRVSSPETVVNGFFVLALLDGARECLRSQIGYCARSDAAPTATFPADTFTVYSCRTFLRDNQQPSCGTSFTTNRVRLILQDRTTLRTVFTADVGGGWSFRFAP